MCVYSAFVKQIGDQYQDLMPRKWLPWPPAPPVVVSPELLKEIRELGKRLDRIDKQLGLKDCAKEEADKRAFEKRIDQLISDAEALKKSVKCEDAQCSADVNKQQTGGGYAGGAAIASGNYTLTGQSAGGGAANLAMSGYSTSYTGTEQVPTSHQVVYNST